MKNKKNKSNKKINIVNSNIKLINIDFKINNNINQNKNVFK
ncbi:hypothetical protein AB2T63_08490 [Clostridium butyricum]|jgi:hypothetical protein|uniref:Uncharacterized protein n=1 Tax=Clostridium butyricum E4 str. BoNT E BL5262 TaxID=632245 RepID=C4IBP2_CLOBU|nr:hypothetical protein [Clostridium butyricum]ETI90102.1 MAG: hypothetical protein Q607_CBUC00062G0005 [Clostridium butyricum DORA_1]APF21466.1 hypothetical protein NPD4_4095 [Clostridium butyricum]EEP56169.1 hypothetical protein CLP_0461 [Clostridium butyricum E4 str. BoNT E BL5262]MDB2152426.1 hypothetical protein [Clostridium butyricum]MDU1005909.1 hypothetical protein [Clostridium butyricum]